jgi:hypothetical protein
MATAALRRGWINLLASASVMACLALAATPGNGQESAVPLTNTLTAVPLRSQPVTVTLSPSPDLKSALDAAERGRASVALAVEGVSGTLTQPVRINVFVNKPDANRTTPLEDPHFLGYIHVPPRRGRVENAGRLFDVPADAVAGLAAPLRVTLVPVVGSDSAPRDASLQIGRIYVRREN